MSVRSESSTPLMVSERMRAASRISFVFLVLLFSISSCRLATGFIEGEPAVGVTSQRWPEAEELFRHDTRWLGGDGAYSADLGSGRVLWLFGDSFIGNGRSRDRHGSELVRNTVALQKGYDPLAATIGFYWKEAGGKPADFFPGKGKAWYWPGSAVLVKGRLLVFLMEIGASDGGLGFEVRGWEAKLIENPGDDPAKWRATGVRTPGTRFGVIVGSACCLVDRGYIYAFGADVSDHGAYLVRWKESDAADGNLKGAEWWAGSEGWVLQERLTRKPAPLFPGAQMEYTVHYEPALGRFLEVQTESFTSHCLVYRTSRSLTGAWSDKAALFCPPDEGTKGLLVYAGKAHPGLAGEGLMCTYALNTLDSDRLLSDSGIYYPIAVKACFSRAGK